MSQSGTVLNSSGPGSPGFKLIQTANVSNVATIDFTTGFGSYNNLFVTFTLGPNSANNAIAMKQSTDGGATWAETLTWGLNAFPVNSATAANIWNNNSTPMQFTGLAIDYSFFQANGFINIRNFQVASYLAVSFDCNFVDQATTTWNHAVGMGTGKANVNALQFLATSGNISGVISVYGLTS